jgi:3-isopropylmalate/(R)-2-methylmalate dehydratase small subunit
MDLAKTCFATGDIITTMKHSRKQNLLIAGKNFGCGSSREHAAWAIKDYGFDVVISSFFADIFRNNALNNFLLPIQVSEEVLQQLLQAVFNNPETAFTVDVAAQTLSVPALNLSLPFEINQYKKTCLLNGFDDIDYLLSIREDIEAFEKAK